MKADRYSLIVAWLKVILPLVALGILSTLFLISRAVDPPSTIPFADTEVQERLTNQMVTGPYYSGTTIDGDQIALVAEEIRTPDGRLGANKAENPDVTIDLVGGTQVTIISDKADVNIAADTTDLFGNVIVTTSQGYVLRSELLNLKMSQIEVISPEDVVVTAPFGHIEAGAMHLFTPEQENTRHLLFTGGVKLLYHP